MDDQPKQNRTIDMKGEEAKGLVEHYMKIFGKGSGWTARHESKMSELTTDVDKAEENTKHKHTEVVKLMDNAPEEPLFKEYSQDMCPCVGESGYELMMETYFEHIEKGMNMNNGKIKKDWWKKHK